MPAFTLYGAHGSANTCRVRLTLAEGGFTDYELVLLDLRNGDQKSKKHKERNPWGRIPVLVSADGFTLYESRAICKYLATKYLFPLLPPKIDVEATAMFDQAQSVEMLYFAEPAGRVSFEKLVKPLLELPTNEAVVSEARVSLEKFFDTVGGLLRQNDYMAGDEFSLVDIYYIPLIQRLIACGYGKYVGGHPAVKAWWHRCETRPAIKKTLAADNALPHLAERAKQRGSRENRADEAVQA